MLVFLDLFLDLLHRHFDFFGMLSLAALLSSRNGSRGGISWSRFLSGTTEQSASECATTHAATESQRHTQQDERYDDVNVSRVVR